MVGDMYANDYYIPGDHFYEWRIMSLSPDMIVPWYNGNIQRGCSSIPFNPISFRFLSRGV